MKKDIKLSKIEEKKEEKKKKLMEASFKLFTKKGIKNTSVQEITDDAGTAKGTFYLYFKDKYELQDQLIIRKSKQLFNDAVKKLNKEKITGFEDGLIFIIDYVINELNKNRLLLKFISKNLSWGLYNEKVTKIVDDNALGVRELFLKAAEENRIKLENPSVTLYMIIELVSSTCFNSIMNKEPLSINEYKPYLYSTIRKMLK
mgnify:FL=1